MIRPGPVRLPPCRRCGSVDPLRMYALMTLWYGRLAGLMPDGGYFYLCPACYTECISPHDAQVLEKLVEQHPFLHRRPAERPFQERLPPPPASG